jgi:peptide/nickel transport system permease protein
MKTSLLHSHAARKFFRGKLAVASLAIVLVYLATGLLVGTLGLITLEQTEQRVGTQNQPGLFLRPDAEKRLADCESLLEVTERALKRAEPAKALAEIQFGHLRIADLPTGELDRLVREGWKTYDALAVAEELDADSPMQQRLAELEAIVAQIFPPPMGWQGLMRRAEMLLGTDRQGRSISLRAVYSIQVAIQIGFVVSLFSVALGVVLGAAAAFFGGWVDHVVTWLFTTLSSVPDIVLLVVLAYMFTGSTVDGTLVPVYVAFGATFWIGTCRVVRGETLKLKELEYIQAAIAMGAGRSRILLRHILPNVSHLMLINFSLLFIGAIKSEVILSFLGLGVKKGPSWGIMLSQSGAEVVTGFFWQIGAATAFMFVLVLAFNVLTDALQDAFDPKHLG